ncbi:hypothetical protein B0T22DRAFT_538516 [Podospora appendiculata]|uniref:Uncharacterized protein n=1 Tax=Podospora appendiculata TaxID=314037 RepID=A0AAE0X266_9PEZI|nr:hypothetical protein B0T22DRAFT_538516 [Podospora appendiculata]
MERKPGQEWHLLCLALCLPLSLSAVEPAPQVARRMPFPRARRPPKLQAANTAPRSPTTSFVTAGTGRIPLPLSALPGTTKVERHAATELALVFLTNTITGSQ